MPEEPYFRRPDTQQKLLDILFIFCKLNPDIGYRQGMCIFVFKILVVHEAWFHLQSSIFLTLVNITKQECMSF